jgi:hypothetical protein
MINAATTAKLINNEVRTAALGLAVGAVHAVVTRRTLAAVVLASTLLNAKLLGRSTDHVTLTEDLGESSTGLVGRTSVDSFADFERLGKGNVLRLRESGGEEGGEKKDGGETHVYEVVCESAINPVALKFSSPFRCHLL